MVEDGPMKIVARAPSAETIRRWLQTTDEVTYDAIGASLEGPAPRGHRVLAHRVRLPDGCFDAAVRAVDRLAMCPAWVKMHGRPEEGAAMAVVLPVGVHVVNLCRVVRRIDEPHRRGFVYGTLPCHVARGEESFWIERRGAEVWYCVRSFSRPKGVMWLGVPLLRGLQRRFLRDSGRAMLRALNQRPTQNSMSIVMGTGPVPPSSR
jgi:uncharacterized protein (UPF0548 family)